MGRIGDRAVERRWNPARVVVFSLIGAMMRLGVGRLRAFLCAATAAAVILVLLVTAIRRRVNALTLSACALFYLGYLLYASLLR